METYQTYLKLFIAFPLVVILAYFCLRFFLRRFAPALGMGRRVQVVERVALSTRVFLYVIRIEDEFLLIASGPSGVTLLKDMGKNWETNDPEGRPPIKNIFAANSFFASLKHKKHSDRI